MRRLSPYFITLQIDLKKYPLIFNNRTDIFNVYKVCLFFPGLPPVDTLKWALPGLRIWSIIMADYRKCLYAKGTDIKITSLWRNQNTTLNVYSLMKEGTNVM